MKSMMFDEPGQKQIAQLPRHLRVTAAIVLRQRHDLVVLALARSCPDPFLEGQLASLTMPRRDWAGPARRGAAGDRGTASCRRTGTGSAHVHAQVWHLDERIGRNERQTGCPRAGRCAATLT
jgi:hypothetical protein